jgi:hypothetical protein
MECIKEDEWKGMLRMKLRAGCKRIGIQGRKFNRVHFPLPSYVQMTPLGPPYMDKIWLISFPKGYRR